MLTRFSDITSKYIDDALNVFRDSAIQSVIDDSIKYKFVPYKNYRKSNTKNKDTKQQEIFGKRFCDELPEDDKRICVKMKIDERIIMLIGKYYKEKHVILNGSIGSFGLDDNDEWVYTSDLND